MTRWWRGESMAAKITTREELEALLQNQRREVSVAIAARAALRALPLIQMAEGMRDFRHTLVLPVFRATAISWAAAKYPAQEMNRTDPVTGPLVGYDASTHAAAAAYGAARLAIHDMSANLAAATAAAATQAAAEAMMAAATTAFSPHTALAPHTAFWSAVSAEAALVEAGGEAAIIASLSLWPNSSKTPPYGVPEQLWLFWEGLKKALRAAIEDWEVWIDWYEDRLAGLVRDEAHELAYVRIGDDLWDQGPAAVNAEIKRHIQALEPPPSAVQRDQINQLIEAPEIPPIAVQVGVSTTGRLSARVSGIITAPPPPATGSPEVTPPEAPLPAPSPATRFIVQEGIVDVVPPTAWAGREAQRATYHARARSLALGFADKLGNVEPKLEGSVQALIGVLGDDPAQLQPDQLRLASRTIAAKARAYGHPSARGELSVESVSTLFELADVLVSLQALVAAELEEHERAIRALDLTEASIVEAKEGLDLVAEAVAASQEIVSEHASLTFEASATASDNAADRSIQVMIEGDRILLTENLILALARELQQSAVNAESVSEEAGDRELPEAPKRKTRKSKGPSQKTRRRSTRGGQKEESWDDLKERFLARLKAKGPEAVADATLAAVTTTIKHSPKSIPVLAALIYAAVTAAPALLAAGGGLSISVLWIVYELWRGK